jgi:sterol desaturase/sphingolipid hydroxylase (fatty acid hydroxylase superfamily)
VYAHPLEFCLGNYAGVALGPALVGCEVRVAAAWYAFCVFGTCFTHSGYRLSVGPRLPLRKWLGRAVAPCVAPARASSQDDNDDGTDALLAAEHHDLHHEFFQCNYGVTPLLDGLFGTSAEAVLERSGKSTFAELKKERVKAFLKK